TALCDAYAVRGFHKLVSRIFTEKTASIALHERCGFRVVGVYRRHGKLDGERRDCVIVEKLLELRALRIGTASSLRRELSVYSPGAPRAGPTDAERSTPGRGR